MKNKCKRLLASLLAFSMVLGSLSLSGISANAEGSAPKVNYAIGATASAEDVEDGTDWVAAKAIDGIVNRDAAKAEQSRWATNKDDAIGAKVLTVDLGAERTLDEFIIEWERTNIQGFDIQVSSDGEDYITVYEKTDDSDVSETTKVTLEEAATGRYVKLVVNVYDGGTDNWPSVSVYEFEIIGAAENLALSATATADSQEDPAFAASKANDGVVNRDVANASQSRWASGVGVAQRWLKLDFGSAKTVKSLVIDWERCNATDYKIQYSNDDSAWTDIVAFTTKPTDYTQIINFSEAVDAQYIRLLINNFEATGAPMNGSDVNWATVSVYEFEAYSHPIMIEEESTATLSSVVANLQAPAVEAGATQWTLPEVPEGFEIEFIGADYEQVIDRNLTIYQPIVDTTVTVNYKVIKGEESQETAAYTVTVPGKYEVEEADNAKPIVIPELAEWKGHTGDFTISNTTKLVINPAYEEELAYVAESFAADYKDVTGNTIEVTYGTAPEAGDFYFTLGSEDAGLKEEGYLMTIADYVTVEAVDKTGAFWAIQTVMQILKQTDGTMPKGITRDYPKFEVRGFMLDVGRKPFKLDYLYDTIKTMAYYKMNDLGVHLNDNYIWVEEYNNTETDQWGAYSAFRLESDVKAGGNDGKNQADLTATDFYYTKDEFRTLIQDAREMGIAVVPEFDAPAHSLAFTKVRPDLAMPEDSVNRWADHLYLENPESEEFIKSIWDEYITGENPVFDSETILNVGTDEYEGNNDAFRQFTANMIDYVQGSGRTVRLWGSLTAKPGSVEVPSEDVQMYIWNTGWANPAAMYRQGYDIINIQDGYVYMVPNGTNNRGGYGDRLNVQSLYNSWAPNTFGGTTLPAGSEQMLGGAFAIWNDNIDLKDNGLGEYDIFDRFAEAAPCIASKAWGDAADMDYTEFTEAVAAVNGVPSINPYSEVESKTDTIVEYNFDESSVKDSSKNKYDGAEGENTAYVAGKEGMGLQLNGGSSYVTTGVENVGPTSEISFWIKMDADAEGEQIIFESAKGAIKAAQVETGKVGFSRDGYDYSFNYTLPTEEWVHLTIVGNVGTAELYVNDELVDTLGRSQTGGLYATLVLPVERIGSTTNAFKGIIDEVTVEKVREIDDSATRIPTDGFTVTCDNQYGGTTTEGVIELAFDGNTNTIWHSNYSPYQALPATIEVDMGQVYTIDQIDYLPRQDGSRNGRILQYEIYAKETAEAEYELLSSGTWASSADIKKVYFDAVDAQYVKIVAITGDTDSASMFASAAEFYIHEYDAKAELRALYEEAAEYENADDYQAENWEAFVAARTAALEVLENDAATAEDIRNATTALQEAMDNLTGKSEVPVNPFEDVYETDYYYAPVMWAVQNGITDGWTETLYAPEMGCTRGQVVTFLWRAAGQPKVENAENPFTDVASNAYYYDAVLWAVDQGITDGWTATTFEPEMTCTRGQIVTFLHRAADEPVPGTDVNPFEDVYETDYYYNAILWAVENQITDGWLPGEFAPDMTCTRGQVVTFLHRASE